MVYSKYTGLFLIKFGILLSVFWCRVEVLVLLCCGPRPQTIVWSNTINNSLKNFLLKTKHIYNNSLEYIIHLIQSVCIASTLFVKVKSKCCVIYHTSCMDRRPQCIVSMPKRHHRAASRLANATTEVRTLTQQHTILIDCVLLLQQRL